MRVISKSRLRRFWELPGREDSEGPLRAWFTHVDNRAVDWGSWAQLASEFATASLVGNCTVFNIGGNKYRLITRVLYPSHKVFVLRVLTHREYDDGKWKTDCGCFEQPPEKSKSARERKRLAKKKKTRRRK